MPNDSTRTVLVALGAGLGVALAKVGAAVFTGSAALAAEAAHSLADSGNDLSLFVAQRRSSRPPDEQHPLGYGREAYFWALIAALGVFVIAAAFSLREGIDELIRPGATSSFAVAYVVLAISTVLDLVSFRQSAGQMIRRARHYHREFLEESRVTSDPSLRAVFVEDVAGFTQPLRPADEERVRAVLLGYPGVTAIRELLFTFVGPGQVWIVARIGIEDGLRGSQVRALVRGIESRMKHEAKEIYRVDVVPIGEAQPASS
jgi:divalent metal cation (Fe/Co/Zn/Cd) transporter